MSLALLSESKITLKFRWRESKNKTLTDNKIYVIF